MPCCAVLSCRLHENRCSPSTVMCSLLDAFVPVNRTLPLVLQAVFGGPPRLGVPQLAVSAVVNKLVLHAGRLRQQQ